MSNRALRRQQTREPKAKKGAAKRAIPSTGPGRPPPARSGGIHSWRPQFYIRTTDVTGSIKLPEGVEMVMPGDNIKMLVDLITPVALEEGVHFAIREGGRTVGAGVLTKILK